MEVFLFEVGHKVKEAFYFLYLMSVGISTDERYNFDVDGFDMIVVDVNATDVDDTGGGGRGERCR